MTYQKLQLPAGIPHDVEELVREQVEALLNDIHAMLRLPIDDDPGLDAGCGFSAALILTGIVAGVSAELYENPTLDKKEQPGDRFVELLCDHYPWSEEEQFPGAIVGRHAAAILYKAYRNPLAHSLGVYEGREHGQLKVEKGQNSEEYIERLEQAITRPKKWTSTTLRTDGSKKAERTKTVLSVECFYWGVRRMIFNVLQTQSTFVRAPASMPVTIRSTATDSFSVTTEVPSGSVEPGDQS